MKPLLIALLVTALLPALTFPVLEVQREHVTAGDLGRLLPLWRELPPATSVIHAPLPGLTRRLARAELERLAAQHGLAGVETTTWPAGIEIRRQMRRLDPAEAESALAAAVARRYGVAPEDVSIDLVRFVPPQVPVAELEFRTYGALLPARDVATVPLTWVTPERRSGTVWLRARVTVRGFYAVAARTLAARTRLEPADMRFEEGDLEARPDLWRLTPADLVGKTLARPVAPGQRIPRPWLITMPAVERGAAVELELSSGPVRVRALGRAEQAGSVGDRLAFRNAETGRRVTARLLDGQRAQVVPEVRIRESK